MGGTGDQHTATWDHRSPVGMHGHQDGSAAAGPRCQPCPRRAAPGGSRWVVSTRSLRARLPRSPHSGTAPLPSRAPSPQEGPVAPQPHTGQLLPGFTWEAWRRRSVLFISGITFTQRRLRACPIALSPAEARCMLRHPTEPKISLMLAGSIRSSRKIGFYRGPSRHRGEAGESSSAARI